MWRKRTPVRRIYGPILTGVILLLVFIGQQYYGISQATFGVSGPIYSATHFILTGYFVGGTALTLMFLLATCVTLRFPQDRIAQGIMFGITTLQLTKVYVDWSAYQYAALNCA